MQSVKGKIEKEIYHFTIYILHFTIAEHSEAYLKLH